MTSLEQVVHDLEGEIERGNLRMKEMTEGMEKKQDQDKKKRQEFEVESGTRATEINSLGTKLTTLRQEIAKKSERLDGKRIELQKVNEAAMKKAA